MGCLMTSQAGIVWLQINDSSVTAPSRMLLHHMPGYRKACR